MYRLNWLAVLGVFVLTGCEPVDVNNFYDIDVVVEDNGNDGAEEPVDDDDSVVEDEETRLEIAYQGPGPGSSIEIGQCGTLIEVTYAAMGGDVTMNSHRFVQLIEDVWSNPFSSVTFLLNGIIHEDLVEFDPNPTGDNHVFYEEFVITEGETLVATYSACIRSDMTFNTQSGTVQAVLDYRFFEAEDENGDAIEFEEEFQYGHRVVVSDPSQWDTCEFELVSVDTEMAATSCAGPMDTVTAFEDLSDGDVVQLAFSENETWMYYMFEGDRYTFPIGLSFTTWYGEDSCPACEEVKDISAPLLASLPLGGNITAKPGSKILTIASDTNMWVVDSCATARAVTPGVAQDIYGTDWADRLVIMPDVFFVDYLIGAPVNSASDFDLVAAEARTIEEELACLWGEDPVEEEPEPLVMAYMPITGTYYTYTKGEEAWLGARRYTNEAGTDLLLTGLQITIQGDDDGNPGNGIADDVNPQDHINACWLQDNVGPTGNITSDIEPVLPNGTVYFNNLSWVIPASGSASITVQVICDLAVMPPQSGDADAFVAVQFSTADIEIVYDNTGDQVPYDQIVFDPAEQPLNGNADFYIQVVDHGELDLTLDVGTPTGYMVPNFSNHAAYFNGICVYEDVIIEELAIEVVTGNPAMIDSITIAYTGPLGNIESRTSFLSSSQLTVFNGIDWYLEDSTWSTLIVYANLNGNANSGDEVTVTLHPIGYGFGATGMSSGHAFITPTGSLSPITASTLAVL